MLYVVAVVMTAVVSFGACHLKLAEFVRWVMVYPVGIHCTYQNFLHGTFVFVKCSPGFTALSGPLREGQKLSEWIPKRDYHRVGNWLQRSANGFMTTVDGVTIRTSTAVAGVQYVVGSLSLDSITFEGDSCMVIFHMVMSGYCEQSR